ncbi:MAG: tRNA (adenosine(37)-N6)-threonylcarbamoyltransferase complex ATPase subunit type 1 TsaE [Bacteroidota bacterium]|jgi:tRNA threonylcarbamoyladenosine biosynthesis protein TsaE
MNTEKIIFVNENNDLKSLADDIISFCIEEKIFLFTGNLGAGKTTLIKAICKKLGVSDSVSSPTFSIINEYYNEDKQKIYHMDLYRIKNESELFDIGFEDYISSSNYCFIEWPEIASGFLPESYVKITISIKEKNIREIVIHKK